MITRLTEDISFPVDEWECAECGKPIGWNLLNERSIHFVECWHLSIKDPLDPIFPKWCDDCVVPSPIPHHQGAAA